jgi:hypothetical protein
MVSGGATEVAGNVGRVVEGRSRCRHPVGQTLGRPGGENHCAERVGDLARHLIVRGYLSAVVCVSLVGRGSGGPQGAFGAGPVGDAGEVLQPVVDLPLGGPNHLECRFFGLERAVCCLRYGDKVDPVGGRGRPPGRRRRRARPSASTTGR